MQRPLCIVTRRRKACLRVRGSIMGTCVYIIITPILFINAFQLPAVPVQLVHKSRGSPYLSRLWQHY
eukprot:scaffold33669_cov154-Skeletonema_menzelii.AAC.3